MFFEAIWDCQINKITLLRLFRIKAQPFSLYEWSHRGKNIQNRVFENPSKKSHFHNINILELFWAIFKDFVTQVFDDKRNSFFLCFYHIHCNKRPKRLKIHVTSKRTSKWSKKTLGLYPALLPSLISCAKIFQDLLTDSFHFFAARVNSMYIGWRQRPEVHAFGIMYCPFQQRRRLARISDQKANFTRTPRHNLER